MKIIVYSLPGVGNTLMLTPHLEAIKRRYPKAKLTVLAMYRSVKEILENNPYIDELIYWNFFKEGYLKSILFLLKLRKRKFDISIMPYPANKAQYNLVNFLAGGRLRIAHKYDVKNFSSFSFLYNKRISINDKRHETEENFELLKLIDVKNKNYKTYLKLRSEEEKYADGFFKKNKLKNVIGMHPGASRFAGMWNKRWPEENFAKLADLISEKYKVKILIFGDAQEKELKEKIYSLMKNKPILVETPNIRTAAALIKKCKLFLTNDSGLMHLSAAVDTPIVAIFGPTSPIRTVPLIKKKKILYKNLWCSPCYKIGWKLYCRYNPKKYECLNSISVEEVFNQLKNLL